MSRGRVREAAGLVLLLLGVAAVGLAFAWPWLPRPGQGGPALARYAPIRDGEARLYAKVDPSGRAVGWESQNRAFVSWLRLYGDLKQGAANALLGFYGARESTLPLPAMLRQLREVVQVSRVRLRQLDGAGRLASSASVLARDGRGELLVATEDEDRHSLTVLDPPALLLPADLAPGREWQGEGAAGALRYRWNGRVAGAEPVMAGGAEQDDCLVVETRFVWLQGEQPASDTAFREWYCAGLGLVRSEERPAGGGAPVVSVLAAAEGLATARQLLPPGGGAGGPEGRGDGAIGSAGAEGWTLERVGRARRPGEVAVGTSPPVFVPGDRPVVVAAGFGGDLYAFDAERDDGAVAWRLHTAGTIYGEAAVEAGSGRLFVGASDKRLYALDPRGLFLWSFRADDNVAGRPLVRDGAVFFGAEDRAVYSLDAATGALRWKRGIEGATISAPAAVPEAVGEGWTLAIGADDERVYGLDPASGEQRWSFGAAGGIEAPLAATDGRLYVASRDGTLAALDPADCEGECEAAWQTKLAASLRTAPAAGQDAVFVVDEDGGLTSLAAEDGARRWSSVEAGAVGPPLVVGDEVIVALRDGRVARYGPDGETLGDWSAAESRGLDDAAPEFGLGPTEAGGALWLIDRDSVVRRLGPTRPSAGPPQLRAAGLVKSSEAPFDGDSLIYTPAAFGGLALLVDFGGGLNLVDPASARGAKLAQLGPTASPALLEPVTAGDRVLVLVERTLRALVLPDGETAWEREEAGTTRQAPTVTGDTVLWLVERQAAGGTASGTLLALDLVSGAERWRAPLEGFFLGGGAVADDRTAYTSTPPAAFDLASGARRWLGEAGGLAIGGPALAEDGGALFVLELDPASGAAGVAAVDTADGQRRWRFDLGAERLSPSARLWVSGGILVVPVGAGLAIGLDAASGSERWRHQAASPRLGELTVADGRVWMVLENSHVLALDAATGAVAARLTSLDLNLNGQGFTQRPTVVGERVLFAIGQHLLTVEAPR